MHQIREGLRTKGRLTAACLLLQLMAAGVAGSRARAAELQEITGFGGEPSGPRMFVYVPDKLASPPPLLVAIHYCTGNAQAFFSNTTYRSQADKHGFIVIYPETTASDRCFDVHSEATLKHDGGGDSGGIAAMVRYALRQYGADASRVYVTGTSSGAMMTNVMLGAYPELFRAGAAFAGVPFGCFAGPDRWNSDCADGKITKTAQEWGELVRAAYPGYTGPRPRMQLWHGDQDETLDFHNFGEEIKQWTNVLGVSEMPTSTDKDAPESGWTRTRYADGAGVARVEAMVGPGMPHNLKVLTDEAVRFFGLDAERDPTDAAGGGAAGAAGGSAMTARAGTGGAGGGVPMTAAGASASGAGNAAPSQVAGGSAGAQSNSTMNAAMSGITTKAAAGSSAAPAASSGGSMPAAAGGSTMRAAMSGSSKQASGSAGTAPPPTAASTDASDAAGVKPESSSCQVSMTRRATPTYAFFALGLLCVLRLRPARARALSTAFAKPRCVGARAAEHSPAPAD